MTSSTTAQLLQTIRDLGLLDGANLREAEMLAEQTPFAADFLTELTRRQHLTAYQAEELSQGRGSQLVLGAYILLQPIGVGGMGQVFRARQKMLGRDCALKIIRKDRLQSADAIERFLREARAAARLKHPNIVTIYDANVADGVHYLAMELLHGTSLAEHVAKQGPLPVGHACRYVAQAAIGLLHAYEQGLVHRDIKPHNLFLEESSDQLKILDLGLARIREKSADEQTAAGALTREGEVMGTPDYMAPEQALDTRSADHRADIYSLGCTLYFLISGRAPFPGGSLTEKLLAHQQKEPVPLETLCSGMPAGLVPVIRKAMAKHPAERYQTPAELADALAPFRNAEHITAAAVLTPAAVNEAIQPSSRDVLSSIRTADIAKPPQKNGMGWVLIALLLVGAFACCPLMVIGTATFLSLFVAVRQEAVAERAVMVEQAAARNARRMADDAAAPVDLEVIRPNLKEKRLPALAFGKAKALAGRQFYLDRNGSRILMGSLQQPGVPVQFHVHDLHGKRLFSLADNAVGLGFADGDPSRVISTLGKEIHVHDGKTGAKQTAFAIPDSKRLVARVAPDGKSIWLLLDAVLAQWDLDTGKEVQRLPLNGKTITDFVISADGQYVLIGAEDAAVQLWSSKDRAIVREYPGALFGISLVALSPDGKYVLACCEQSFILWERENPAQRQVIMAHDDLIVCAAFSPDSKRIVSADREGGIRDTDTQTGASLGEYKHAPAVLGLAFLPDGRRVIAVSADNAIRMWGLPK